MQSRSQEIFERYLAAVPPEEAEALLAELLVTHGQPLLQRAVERRLGRRRRPADAADLANEATAELLARLRTLRADANAAAFRFDALATAVAANTVHRHWGRLFPEWGRLRKRLRYAVETDGGIALWRNPRGELVCGLEGAGPESGEAAELEIAKCRAVLQEEDGGKARPVSELARRILARLARPIEFRALADMVARLSGVRDRPPLALGDHAAAVPDPAPDAGQRLAERERLEILWREIRDLPPRQRAALLLNLRTSHGAALWIWADLGVARFDELAACLEMTPRELAELWNRLPLEDMEIAGRFGLERQQIINLRQAARQRLARRTQTGARAPIRERNRS